MSYTGIETVKNGIDGLEDQKVIDVLNDMLWIMEELVEKIEKLEKERDELLQKSNSK